MGLKDTFKSSTTWIILISALLISLFIFIIIYALKDNDTTEDNTDSSLKGYSVTIIVLSVISIIAIIVFFWWNFTPSEIKLEVTTPDEAPVNPRPFFPSLV
jgi:UDP-N-acetylmuramyl pentapeptide phosphotransferase/UDP-N-acetylglucosamine-1-phosphate transferase